MAKSPYTYKKYEENRKKSEKFLKNLEKSGKKARSASRKYARQKEAARNKRLREYERERKLREQAREKERTKNVSASQEQLSGNDLFSVFVFMLIIAALFILVCKVGFLRTVLIVLILLAIVVVICVTIESLKAERAAELAKNIDVESENVDRSNQIPYLKNLLAEIRKHQAIANTSNDPDEVKKHLDSLISVMDEIATFDDAILKQAGMTKVTYESAKAEILEVYDAMIAQARTSDDED